MKKVAVWLLVLLVIGGAAVYIIFGRSHKGDGKDMVTASAKVGDITSSVSATGKVNPKVSVLVGTEVSGTIREIKVDYNSPVKKGQLLLKLDQETFRTQVDQATANLQSAESRLRELVVARDMQLSGVKTAIDQKKAALDKAEADYGRSQKLFDKGMISRQDLDAAREVYLVNKSQYEQSVSETAKNAVTDAQICTGRATVAQARASLRSAQTNLSKTVITAPMDGVVIERNVEVGQTVAASFATPNLLTIGDLKTMQVDISIDEADVGEVKVGGKAEFTVDAFPNKVFTGTVSKIYYAPVIVQNVVTYNGVVDVQNPEGMLRPGMTANVRLITSEKKGVLLIPSSALRVKMGGEGNKTQARKRPDGGKTVWVMKDGKPSPVRVVTGVTDFVNTEVVEGLKEGDVVVVEAPSQAGTGQPRAQGAGGPPRGGLRF